MQIRQGKINERGEESETRSEKRDIQIQSQMLQRQVEDVCIVRRMVLLLRFIVGWL